MKETPNYYAILPAPIRYAKISAQSKLIYAEITSLSNGLGFCVASNDYFAKLYGTTTRTIANNIRELKEHGFIKVEIKNNNKRKIYVSDMIISIKNANKKQDPEWLADYVAHFEERVQDL